ncbi:hypothetical protein SAMN05216516_1208 [Izhakiella capsodis]|uniref:Uncharacterized protein n=1 Tax=Izhakiella capsodis TaxID=1367852 RepID=A0A1I5BPP1_9GAMM|nr:hypothetical protein [Izhakiella capsodis]SFN76619.1 hypothetical protein SAMN05216516_1208 [Izhakiella capsodis]
MSKKDNEEQKLAYVEALKLADVSRDMLKVLHKVNDNTLDKWLYVPDRYPPFRACWELWMYIRRRREAVARPLQTLIHRSITRADDASKKAGPVDKKKKIHNVEGKWSRDNFPIRTYLVNGKLLSIKEAGDELGYPRDKRGMSNLYFRLRREGINPGSDITDLKYKPRGGSQKKKLKK